MRTLVVNFEANSVALACGAPGLVASTTFAVEPLQPVLDGLAELFEACKPERVLLGGAACYGSALVEQWLRRRGQLFDRMVESAVDEIANALTMGAIDLDIVDGPAQFEKCRPGEDRALAMLELNHRLSECSPDQLRGRVYQ